MNKFNVLVLFTLLSFGRISAQSIDELYEDPDIVWMVVTSEIFPLETPDYPVDKMTFVDLQITKYEREGTPFAKEDNLMTAQILAAMRAGNIPMLDAKEQAIEGKDIVTALTYPYESTNVSPSKNTNIPAGMAPYYAEDILDYEIQMLWYYNKKDKQLASRVIGWQPVTRDWEWYSDGKEGEYTMVVDVEQLEEYPTPDLSSEHVNYALTCHYNFDFAEAEVIKGKLTPFFQRVFFKDILENKRPTYSDFPTTTENLFTKEALKFNLKEMRDTIITFDPESYEETLHLIDYDRFDIEASSKFRIVQVIYFDNQNKNICSKLLSLAPLRASKIKENDGDWEPHIDTPIFYIKFE